MVKYNHSNLKQDNRNQITLNKFKIYKNNYYAFNSKLKTTQMMNLICSELKTKEKINSLINHNSNTLQPSKKYTPKLAFVSIVD